MLIKVYGSKYIVNWYNFSMSDDSNLLAIVITKLSEVSETVGRVEAKQEIMYKEVEYIKEQDVIQNSLLAEHIQGTEDNRQRLELEIEVRKKLESRINKLEEPGKFLRTLKKYIAYILVVGGAILSIAQWFKG